MPLLAAQDSLPTHEDVGRLVYCTAVLKETLRLYPPAPLTARNTTAPLTLSGVDVPVGTMIWLPLWWIHRCEANWDRPNEFDPGRFLPPRAGSAASGAGAGAGAPGDGGGKAPAAAAWFPFSAGRRSCVGQKFAMLEGTILLAMLVRSLVFKRCAEADGAPEMRPVSSGFVSCAENGVHLRVSVR